MKNQYLSLFGRSALSLAVLFSILIPLSLQATTYYVSASRGSDDNSGRGQASAWKSIAKVNRSSFKPGDIVLFKRGEKWREQLKVPSSGTAAGPITFASYGLGPEPLILGSEIVSSWGSYGGSIYTSPVTWSCRQLFQDGRRLTLKASIDELAAGCWFQDPYSLVLYVVPLAEDSPASHVFEAAQREHGVFIYQKSYVKLKNLAIQHINDKGAIYVGLNSFGNKIESCKVSYTGGEGILLEDGAYGNQVSNNYVSYSLGPAGTGQFYSSCGIMARQGSHNNKISNNKSFSNHGSGIFLANSFGNVVMKNKIYDNGSGGIDVNDVGSSDNQILNNAVYNNGLIDTDEQGISFYNSGTGNVARGNTVHHQHGGANDGSGIAVDCTANKVIIERNISYYNSGHGLSAYASKETVFRNNVSYGNSHSGIFLGGESPDIQVLNNISHANGGYQVSIQRETIAAGGLVISNNDFYKDGGTIVADYGGTGYSAAGFDAVSPAVFSYQFNPRFISPVADFKLKLSSPCINKGSNVGLPFLGPAPDLGAWEIR